MEKSIFYQLSKFLQMCNTTQVTMFIYYMYSDQSKCPKLHKSVFVELFILCDFQDNCSDCILRPKIQLFKLISLLYCSYQDHI